MISFNIFLKLFVSAAVIILSLIAGFNYWIDPAGIFNNKKVDIAVNYLINGKAVDGLTNYNERILKKELILKAHSKAETIVLGSSRAMGILKEYDKSKKEFANYSVSGANFNDDIGLLYIYYNYNKDFPKKLILAVEPWSLNKNRSSLGWKSLEQEYYTGMNLIGLKIKNKEKHNLKYKFEQVKTLLTISYLKNSIKTFKSNNKLPSVAEIGNNYEKDIILPYGSLKYGQIVENMTVKDIEEQAKKYIANGRIYQLDDFNELDEFDKTKFITLIEFLKSNNVETILWFPPYHPLVYQYIEKNNKFKNVLKAEEFFREIAYKENLKIYGSYNPVLCGVEETDFSDGMHLRTSGYKKIFKNKF